MMHIGQIYTKTEGFKIRKLVSDQAYYVGKSGVFFTYSSLKKRKRNSAMFSFFCLDYAKNTRHTYPSKYT